MITWLLLLLTWTGLAHAARLQVDLASPELVVGQTVSFELQLVDGKYDGIPQVPVPAGLRLDYQGQGSSRVSVNFQTTRIVRYTYALTALQEGTFSLGPIELQVGGEQVLAPAVSIHVSPREQVAGGPDLVGLLSDPNPWLGQVVLYQLTYRHRDQVYDLRWTPPTYDGFLEERVAEAAQKDYQTVLDGVEFSVLELAQPLVATGEGKRVVTPAVISVKVPDQRKGRRQQDPFGGFGFGASNLRSDSFTTSPIPVMVRPLPKEGRPGDFSGLVGRFSLSVKPSTSSVALGGSLTLEITLTGDGTLAGFKLPPPPSDAGYRAYDDDPVVQAVVRDGQFLSQATFKRAIVPDATGTLHLPALELSVFDPERGQYTRIAGPALDLRVGPGEAGGGEVSSFGGERADARQEVSALGDDILPAPGAPSIADRSLRGRAPLALALVGLPALGWAGIGLLGWRARRPSDPWLAIDGGLASLPAEPGARLRALETVFREGAALRLSQTAPGLDRAAVAALGPEVEALYVDLEAARYGGAEVDDLEARVRRFVAVRP